MKIKWQSTNDPGASADAKGNWQSANERFEIWPGYRHTVFPDHYNVRDRYTGQQTSFDRVRDCKEWAQYKVDREQMHD